MKKLFSVIIAGVMVSGLCASAQTKAEGFYKDLFMDSGVPLNSYDDLPAAKLMNLSMERVCNMSKSAAKATEYEKQIVADTFAGTDVDENGVLLYPDGAPRFKIIYMNGGQASAHAKFLTPQGVRNIRTFYANGGSYVGTCAGAYITSKGVVGPLKDKNGNKIKDGRKIKEELKATEYAAKDVYLGIWPGYVTGTTLSSSYTGVKLEKKSKLLDYYDFGGDRVIDSVRHNGGCFMSTYRMPAGTEILGRFIADTMTRPRIRFIHDEVNCWAYKADAKSGRLVVTGSHPERMITGDRIEMFTSMFKYALAGQGEPQVKAALVSGEAREMTLGTKDNKPEFTAIGDKQYHHFTIDVPKGTKSVTVDLKSVTGRADYDLFLYAACGKFAFNDQANWFNVLNGVDKTLVIDNPKAGKLYISVFCDTTVDVIDTKYGEKYTGRVDVLNGVPYIITATLN